MDERTLQEIYLPPFEAATLAGPQTLRCGSGTLNGIPLAEAAAALLPAASPAPGTDTAAKPNHALAVQLAAQCGVLVQNLGALPLKAGQQVAYIGAFAETPRYRGEGAASPADVFITVDAANLQAADDAGLFAPVRSKTLDARIPAQFRGEDNRWFGFAYRARVIAYDRNKIKPDEVRDYTDLANPRFKGKICVRSGGHVYNRTLMASMIYHLGDEIYLDGGERIAAGAVVLHRYYRAPSEEG